MKKKITIVIIVIMILISLPFLIFMIPIKHVSTNLELSNEPQESLIEGETKQIYVTFTPDNSNEIWDVLGKDGALFSGGEIIAQGIIVSGNFPKKINHDLLPKTIFILNGKYYIRKIPKDINYTNSITHLDSIGCFEVESWNVLGSIKRCESKYLSKSSLTVEDYIMEEVIPVG